MCHLTQFKYEPNMIAIIMIPYQSLYREEKLGFNYDGIVNAFMAGH